MTKHVLSRRDLLRAGLAGAAIAVSPPGSLASTEVATPAFETQAATAAAQAPVPPKEPLENLSASGSDTLEAMASRSPSAAQYGQLLPIHGGASGCAGYKLPGLVGDGGPDSCDDPSTEPATTAASVNLLASTPFDTAVGGTEFNEGSTPSTYWNATNNRTTGASAKGYIPEDVWNESCTTAQVGQTGCPASGLWSSGGGIKHRVHYEATRVTQVTQ